jgi:hypothetical protein
MEEAAHLDSESKKNTFEVRGPAPSTQLGAPASAGAPEAAARGAAVAAARRWQPR